MKPAVWTKLRSFAFGNPVRAAISPYLITLLVVIALTWSFQWLPLGDSGGIIAFVALVTCAWYLGVGPSLVSPLLLGLTLRLRVYGLQEMLAFSPKESFDILVITIVTTVVGISGMLRRRSEAIARRQAIELIEQDRRKDEFLATLAHELRNPLSPIRMGVELLDMLGPTPDDPATVLEVHRVMRRQIDQLVRLIDDLMDVSRINTGKIEIRKSVIRLADVIRDAVEAVRPGIDSAGHHLLLTVPDKSILVNADQVRLSQVLVNLLNNAIKFTDTGGKISVETHLVGDSVEILIRDTGIGISADLLPHIFELFVQSDDLLTRRHGGLGIGLSLARALMRLHGGDVRASSEGIGRGSLFVVSVPRGLPKTTGTSDVAVNPTATTRRRILIVDDNQDAATTLASMLATQGHQCDVAFDGHAALQAASRFQPDAFFLDLGMPTMSGFELAAHLRSTQDFKSSLLVALTGWGRSQDRQDCLDSGFDEHLVKPATPDQLKQILQTPRV